MKRTITIILCLCMALSLCACGALDVIRDTELPPRPTPITAPAETPAPDLSETAAPTPAREPAPAAAEGGAELGERVLIYYKKTQETEYAPDAETLPILQFSYVTPVVRMDGNRDAAEEINEQLRVLDELYYSGSGSDAGKNHLFEAALDNLSYIRSQGSGVTPFSSARSVDCTRADGSVISFLYRTSVFTGGTQDERGYVGRNYSSESGERLTLDMLAADADADAFRQRLRESVVAAAREDKELIETISRNDLDADTALGALVRDDNWYFSGEGVVFFSSGGELCPKESGVLFFTVPYAALNDLIDPKFLPAEREGEGSLSISRLDDMEDGSVWIIDRLALSEGEELCLRVEGTVYDLEVSSFLYVDHSEQDDRFYETARHWYASYMSDCALQICAVVPEGMPDLMIRYTDADHVLHRLFISESGVDGGVTLVDDTIRAVG